MGGRPRMRSDKAKVIWKVAAKEAYFKLTVYPKHQQLASLLFNEREQG